LENEVGFDLCETITAQSYIGDATNLEEVIRNKFDEIFTVAKSEENSRSFQVIIIQI
jgi:hypothetical protein